MNYASRFALTTFLSLALGASAFAAQDPVAKPLSAWLVGPSQASAFDKNEAGDGCLMVTEFDNGMIVGMHAREQGVVGMTVDTGADTLQPGTNQSVGMNVGGDAYVMNAVASDTSTLSLNLDEAGGGKDVAERLTTLGNFRLLINEQPYYFATTGFTDGLARLQACMGGTMAVPVVVQGPGDTAGKVVHDVGIETMRVTSSGHDTPLALAMPSLIPSGYRFVLDDVNPMIPVSWQAGDDWVAVMQAALQPHGLKMAIKDRTIRIGQRVGESDPVIEGSGTADGMQVDAALSSDDVVAAATDVPSPGVSPDVPVGVWGGAAGENLADVLEAWGLMSGVNVKVDLDGDYKLPKDVRYEGRFDEAVQQLLAQFDGAKRPSGTFLGLSGAQNAAGKAAASRIARAPAAEKDSGWRPSPISKISKSSTRTWAPVKQMTPIPDPANAPKTVKKDDSKPKKAKTSGTWSAMEGTSLRDVLEQWGSDAGVDVVWTTDQNFPLVESIKKKGKFEEAVMDALAQYEGQGVRPTAQLNQDPDTGKKALIIKTTRL